MGAVGEEAAVAAGLRPPPVPGEQRIERRLKKPALGEAPVHLAHHDPAHRRLRAVPGLAPVPPVVVRQEPLGGVAPEVLDDAGEPEVAAFEHREVAEEEVVPAEERHAAVLAVPEPAHGGDDPFVAGLVDGVPGKAGGHREPRFGEFPELRGPRLEFGAAGVEDVPDVRDRFRFRGRGSRGDADGRGQPRDPVRRETARVGVGFDGSGNPDEPLAVRKPGEEAVSPRFHRAGPVPGHPRAHHQREGSAGLRVRGYEDRQFAVFVVSRFDRGGEAAPGDFEALVRAVHGADAGTDHFRALLPLPDERLRQVVLFEVAVPLEAEVHREPVGQQDVAQHAAAVPGVPAGGEPRLDRPVLGDVADRGVVFGVPVRPVGGGGAR